MNAILPGQARSSPRENGCQLRVQRRGRNLHQFRRFGPKQRGADRPLGIKLPQHRPVERELADIGRRRLGGGRAAGRDWSCNRRSGPRSGVTTSRSICPETSAGGRPGRSSRPTIETSARLPGANTDAKRGSAIRASTLVRQRLAVAVGPAVGVAGEVLQARRRGGVRWRDRAAIAAAGAPACRAAARGRAAAMDSPVRERSAFVLAGIGRAQPAVDGLLRRSRRCAAIPAATDGALAAASAALPVSGVASSARQ